MTIKSVREINFFQELRNRHISVSFCDLLPGKRNDELLHLVQHLITLASREIAEQKDIQLSHLDKDCVSSLISKFTDHSSNIIQNHEILNSDFEGNTVKPVYETEETTLTFLETVELHKILVYFEDNHEKFKLYTEKISISHQLTKFIITPSNYYNSILIIKNTLEHKLGEAVVNSYKFK